MNAAMHRSLPLLIGCALLAATSSVVRSASANTTSSVPASAGRAQLSMKARATPGTPAAIVLTGEPATILCDGAHSATVTATVTDASGAHVPDGLPVNFSALTSGTATVTVNPAHADTKNGVASSIITPHSASSAGMTMIVSSGSVQSSVRVDCLLPLEYPRPPAPRYEQPPPLGGQLSIGTPLGKSVTGSLVVPINTTAATDAYYGYAIHLEFDGNLIDAAGSDVTPTFGGSTLDAGGVPGFDGEVGALDAYSITAAAWKAGGQSTTLAGTLTHVWLKPRPGAAGCSYLHLETLGAPDWGIGTAGPPSSLAFTASYTINAGDGRPQQNSYGPDAGVDVETGTACTASAPALPRSGTGGARGGGRPLLLVTATLCSLAAGTALVMAGRAARRRRLSE